MTKTKVESTAPNRYQGFSLRSVCWGYRDIFENAIEGLFAAGSLGAGKEATTEQFFSMLKNADQSCYDHILKEFLSALNPRTRWLMDIPSVFSDVTETGRMLAEKKLYHGIGYFRILGEGGFGDTPDKVRHLLTLLRRLLEIHPDLAFAFLKGYGVLLERLTSSEIDRYINEGLLIYRRNLKAGERFMAAESKASENIIQMITQECRLDDIKPSLTNLVRALVGEDIEIDDLGQLDSDDLIERGTHMVCMYKWLYLPTCVRHFDKTERNHDWYRLCTVVASAMLCENTFSCLHGHPDFSTITDIAGSDIARINLYTLLEYVRALRSARRRWPGSRRLIEFGFKTEFGERPPECLAEELLRDAICSSNPTPATEIIITQAGELRNAFDTAAAIDRAPFQEFLQSKPELGERLMRAFAFLPDFLYPGKVSSPPPDSLIADMKDEASRSKDRDEASSEETPAMAASQSDSDSSDSDNPGETVMPAQHWYPEWNQSEGDYYENWCGVTEMHVQSESHAVIPDGLSEQAQRVRRTFERLKPDIARTERRLEAGDSIDMERLVRYRINRRLESDPRVDFYEKPMILRRDLAVLILLDISGSTGESIKDKQIPGTSSKVLDMEKHAALILGEGLDILGDQFAVAGFSSNGREQCEYYLFKNFKESWDTESTGRIMGALPRNSTRIGAALRHSGSMLRTVDAKQRLIILVTDGKPMDSGYDPHSRYAQYDVRMACEENEKLSIATFAISTEENTLADMEIMFPRKRFAILPDIRRLPDILPELYVRMTVR